MEDALEQPEDAYYFDGQTDFLRDTAPITLFGLTTAYFEVLHQLWSAGGDAPRTPRVLDTSRVRKVTEVTLHINSDGDSSVSLPSLRHTPYDFSTICFTGDAGGLLAVNALWQTFGFAPCHKLHEWVRNAWRKGRRKKVLTLPKLDAEDRLCAFIQDMDLAPALHVIMDRVWQAAQT